MVNGIYSKWCGVVLFLLLGASTLMAQNNATQYKVEATPLEWDAQDLKHRKNNYFDQNGERCALIIFETPIPKLFKFEGPIKPEKRELKDDEIWLWISPDAKKLTIRCENCVPLKEYRWQGITLKGGNVYRAKLTTGLPKETAVVQNVQFYCDHTPFFVSIDGAKPEESKEKSFHTELPIGTHNVTIEAKLYKSYTGTFRVLRSHEYTDTISLASNYGEIFFNVTPAQYSVYVDNEKTEFTRSLKLEPGTYNISVRKERYIPFETQVVVEQGKSSILQRNLEPAFAVFNILAAEEETEIWVDGENKGHHHCSISLDFGKHVIEGRRDGYDSWQYPETQFNSSTVQNIKIPKLNRQYGAVRLSFYPQEATVIIDGKLAMMTDGVYTDPRISTGVHYISARLTDYRTKRDSFSIANGKMLIKDYELDPIALGTVSISTDAGILISRLDQESGDPIPLRHTNYSGKFPAGENVVELRNLSGIKCYYKMFVNEKEENEPVTFHFQRKLMVRSNVVGREIKLKGGVYPAFPIKANKKHKLDPMKYEITVNKRGYAPYVDSIDLSDQNVKSVIYRANLHKLNDTVPRERRYHSPEWLQRFYDNAGTWFVGIIDFGYTFDFNGIYEDPSKCNHIITLGAVPFRYRMLGLNLADFEFSVNAPSIPQTICYVPKISLCLPMDRGFAFRFYGGFAFNLYDNKHEADRSKRRSYILGGASMRFNYVGKFPMDVFAEYKWPMKGETPPDARQEQLFRVGVSFSTGIDL